VRHIGNRFLNNVDMSAQEAVYLLLQLPLERCSREVVFINTSPPEERVYLLKSNIDLLADDAEISASNLIKRYIDRTSQLEHVCLANFAALCDRVKSSTTMSKSDVDASSDGDTDAQNPRVNCRKVPRVIRFVHCNSTADPENSPSEKLMLYFPWRNEKTDLLGAFASHSEHFEHVKQQLVQSI
jgi:hypothetical protein